jgi:hypothetical protein
MHGITLNCLERLIAVRPDLAAEWRGAAAYLAPLLAASVEPESKPWNEYNTRCFGADYLITAHRLFPQGGYDLLSRRCLEACMRLASLNTMIAGDDYRNMFLCENHAHWMKAYWQHRPG